MRQMPLALGPDDDDGFDGVVAGPNAQPLHHLRALADAAAHGEFAEPHYLWGGAGQGKTRLLRAVAAACRAAGAPVGWFDAGSPPPWRLQPHWRLVVLDRCEALDDARQHAAYGLFNDCAGAGVQWLAAGRLPPVDLPLREDLRTRLGWGQVHALAPLGDDALRDALGAEAERRGIELSDDVVDYLLVRQERSLAHLMALLGRLDVYALAAQRAVTVPLVRRMLDEEAGAEPVVLPIVATPANAPPSPSPPP